MTRRCSGGHYAYSLGKQVFGLVQKLLAVNIIPKVGIPCQINLYLNRLLIDHAFSSQISYTEKIGFI